jgi:hypothetical protein
LLLLDAMSFTESTSACGTPFTAATKAAGSAAAKNSSAWPVAANDDV